MGGAFGVAWCHLCCLLLGVGGWLVNLHPYSLGNKCGCFVSEMPGILRRKLLFKSLWAVMKSGVGVTGVCSWLLGRGGVGHVKLGPSDLAACSISLISGIAEFLLQRSEQRFRIGRRVALNRCAGLVGLGGTLSSCKYNINVYKLIIIFRKQLRFLINSFF